MNPDTLVYFILIPNIAMKIWNSKICEKKCENFDMQ